jgi:hypothetical protein
MAGTRTVSHLSRKASDGLMGTAGSGRFYDWTMELETLEVESSGQFETITVGMGSARFTDTAPRAA